MSTSQSTLAQLLFKVSPALNFAQVVGDLDTILAKYPATHRTLSWDCEDVAVFDLDGSRIVLGYADRLTGSHAACLTVSVGHGPNAEAIAPLADRSTSLCRLIADRIAARHPVNGTIWHEIASPVTPDLIQTLIEKLPRKGKLRPAEEPQTEIDRLLARMSVELQTRVSQPVPNFVPPEKATFAPLSLRPPQDRIIRLPLPAAVEGAARPSAPQPAAGPDAPGSRAVANDTPAVPRLHDEDAARIRAALYPPQEPVAETDPSTQMRLAVHAMNTTLILVYLPVGAAMLTYSLLRGENMRASTQAMVLTGLLMLAGQSPLGHQVMSMI